MNLESIVVKHCEQLRDVYKGVYLLSRENHSYSILTEIPLVDPINGKIWETYSVRIIIPPNYPDALPIIYENGEKIPKDRHINSDGSCCLAPIVQQMLILGNKYSLIDFVDKLVIPFLANQKLVACGQGWSNGEYSHGGAGLLEFYKELLKINSTELVLQFLQNSKSIQSTSFNKKCFCGSKRKFSDCHKFILEPLNRINALVFYNDFIQIENYLIGIKNEKKK